MTKTTNIRTGNPSLRTIGYVGSARNGLLIEAQALRKVTLRHWQTVRHVPQNLNVFIFTVKCSNEDAAVLCVVLRVTCSE
jgi:hypothetical protein